MRECRSGQTKIDKQMKRKRNPEIVETILKAKKNEKWLEVSRILSSPRSRKISINLEKIEKETKEGDTVVIPGKVLGEGDITKKIRVAALSFSGEAEKKLKEKNGEIVTILEEIKVNPKAEGIRILK